MAITFFARYFAWHYSQAPKLMVGVWKNILWFLGHLFSVDTLWRSLFMPWKRIVATTTKKWDFEDMASAALANFLSRIIGAIMRLVLIIIGRTCQVVWIVFGIVLYVSWFVMPFLIVLLFFYGLSLMFSL